MTNPEPTEQPNPEAETTPEAPAAPTEESSREAHKDATKYRTQLREAEARIERMQRAEIERLAGATLSHAEDLFSLSGNDVADFLTEAGDVDPAKVAADLDAILAERPGLRRPAPAADRSQGFGIGIPSEKQPTWSDLLRNN